MAISNLTTQYISSSFQTLMQVSSSGLIYNGIGTQVTNLVLTSVTASFNGLINSASVAILANTATSASYATTASYALSTDIDISNLATTGSNTFIGNQNVTGNVNVTGTLTANTYILSSSVTSMTIEFASGSTAFGNSSDDTHTFIGSVTVTGSFLVSGSSTFRNIGPAQFTGSVISTQGFTGSLQGTATSASYAVNSDSLNGVAASNYVLGTSITGFATTSSLSSYALTTAITGFATTSSLASASVATASYAATASYIDPTFISASAAASGFGTGGGGSVTINNNNDNNIITATGTANTFNGENRFTFNGTELILTGSVFINGPINTVSDGITGSLQGTATTASYVLLAESASYISPTFISASVAAFGFATTGSIGTSITTSTTTDSLISNTFYTADSTSGAINISLKPNTAGAEFTFFATNLTNDIAFVASSTTIVSEDSFLKMNKVGSAVTAKYYTSSTVALIGSLKA